MAFSGPRTTSEQWSGPRPDPFALPSAATGRLLLLVTAVVGASIFAYDYLYLTFDTRAGTATAVGSAAAVWMISGVLALLLTTAVIYLVTPAWIIRRRRLAPLAPEDSPELAEEVHRLVRKAGLARPPVLLVDAFNPSVSALVFGLPGRRYMRLNAGLVTRSFTDIAVFQATIRHELAHLRNRDVDQTYIAMAVWHAFLLTALAPLAAAVLRQPSIDLIGMSWRAIALTAIVLLFRNSVLRAREYSADARALQWDGPDGALRRVLRDSATSASRTPRWPFGTHPMTAAREGALDEPLALFQIGFWDAAGVGLASTIAFGNVTLLINSLIQEPAPLTIRWVAALFFAPLAAVSVTMGVWRAVLYAQSAGRPLPSTLPAGVGLGCGILVGEPLSLPASITGIWGSGPAPDPVLAAVAVLVLIAGTALLAAWMKTCALAWLPIVRSGSRRVVVVVVVVAVAASAVVLTVLLGYWTLLRDLYPLLPSLMEQDGVNYAMLSASGWLGPVWFWMLVNHQLVLHLIQQDPVVITVVLLWLFPVVGILCGRGSGPAGQWPVASERPPRLVSVVLIGGVGSAAYAVGLLIYRAMLHASISANGGIASDDFLQVFAHWQIAGAVAAQAVVALGVALSVGSFRVVWGQLAAFVTGTVAVAAMLGTIVAGGCFSGLSVRPGPCAWDLDNSFVVLMTRWILVEGAFAAIAAGLLGAGLAAISRRTPAIGPTSTTPPYRPPAADQEDRQ